MSKDLNSRATGNTVATRRSIGSLPLDGSALSARTSGNREGHATTAPGPRIVNAMTVDVEDYFQVSAFEPHVERAAWPYFACRLESRVERILEMYAEADVKATFFTLGWVAERFPDMVRRIVAEGHELASHGWEHRMVTTQTPEEFAHDVRRTKAFLEDLGGVAVSGYRAPSYSINATNNRWAHDGPARGGLPLPARASPRSSTTSTAGRTRRPRPFPVAGNELLEVPISTIEVGSRRIACGGGGWFRLYPYALSKRFTARLNEQGERYVFYFHPWEIDPEQPRMPNVGRKTRFRHYVNLGRMEGRVQRLLEDFAWDRMDRVFQTEIDSVAGPAPEPRRRTGAFERVASF